ncbi:MAG: type II and III secretion system protein family protein, partial [Hyphomicrobiales bacterium]
MTHHRQTSALQRPVDGPPARRRPAGRPRPCILAAPVAIAMAALIAITVAMGLAAPAVAQSVVNISDGERVGDLTVSRGQSQTIRVSEPYENIVVGNPATVDIAPLTDQTLYVLGLEIGTTNLAVYNEERELIGVVDVEVTFDVSGMREAMAAALPDQPIEIRTVGGRIMLQGAVQDATMVDRAMDIARDYAGDEGVTNALSVASPQQVTLEVRVIEAQRTLGRDLGVSWDVTGDGFRFTTLAGLTSGNLPFGEVLADVISGGTNVDVVIEALEQKGVARRLAEPNLTALSGEAASFHAGGEFPVPVVEEGRIGEGDDEEGVLVRSVTFKPFGVRLSFTPTVLGDGVVNLLIEPEVSEPNFANAVGGIPSLSTRRARTTVELRDGQSMAMAGLLQTTNNRSVDQIPWLGDLPILGALFRSQGFQKDETELVGIVTPRLVQP